MKIKNIDKYFNEKTDRIELPDGINIKFLKEYFIDKWENRTIL